MPATRRSRFRAIVSRLKGFASYTNAFTSWGSAWKTTFGTWTGSSGTASTSTAASSYPFGSVNMASSNVTATLKNTSPGSGIALWVTDSNNWWAVVTEQEQNTAYNCQTCTSSYTGYFTTNCLGSSTSGGSANYTGGNWNASSQNAISYYNFSFLGICNNCASFNISAPPCYCPSCKSYTTSNCTKFGTGSSGGFFNASNQNAYSIGSYNQYVTNYYYFSCTGSNTNYSNFSCNCSTVYPAKLRLIQSVSGVVSEITRWTVDATSSTTQKIKALKVITNGSTGLTIRPYSDTSATTQIGSDLTYTASGASIKTQFGIIVAPATFGQGSTTGELSVVKN